jgi:hypothetical protein
VTTTNPHRSRNHFVSMIFVQIFGTAFFSLQWVGMYVYWSATQHTVKSLEKQTIDSFVFFLANNLYYFNNVKSFFLSTLTSHRFRLIFVTACLKLLREHRQRMVQRINLLISNGTKIRRKQTLQGPL